MQGLWWLGKRSVTPLPPSILNWFYEVRGKLQEAGQALAPVEASPIIRRWLTRLSAPSNNWIKLSLMICNSLRKTHIKEGA